MLTYIILSGVVPRPTGVALLFSWLGWGRPGVKAGPPFPCTGLLRQQATQIQMAREHSEAAISRARPLFLRPVPIELHTVVVGVVEIDCFADTVVCRAFERDAGLLDPPHGGSQLGSCRIQDSDMIQTRRAGRRWLTPSAFPGVQAEITIMPSSA